MAWIWFALAAALAFVSFQAVIKLYGSLALKLSPSVPQRVSHVEGSMAWILNALNILQEYFGSLETLPFTSLDHLLQPTQLNDYVYEVCKPRGRPCIEVVFFHGLQLDGAKQTYLTTWLSRNDEGTELWPLWIMRRREMQEARILLVSYDGFLRKTDAQGCTDMCITSENLVQSLTEEAVQLGRDGCPVVLVGHCIGGLVIKELLLRANSMLMVEQNEHVQCLLESVKELFYYATPHNGSEFFDFMQTDFLKGLLFERITILNKKAARRNEKFRKLRQMHGWKACGIGENLPVKLGTFDRQLLVLNRRSERQLVVEEASARSDVDKFYTLQADHFDVCRPKSDKDSSFSLLMNVIDRALTEDMPGHEMCLPTEFVGLGDQVRIVKEALKKERRFGIVGTGGWGKSTLAKAVYNSISGDFEYSCFLSNVKNSINKTDTVDRLQAKILESLYYKGRRKLVDWRRLKGKKILFVLDDVEYESQVYTKLGAFSDESCVLVTSRDCGFLKAMGIKVHDVKLLDYPASNRLFCLHAFKREDAPEAYKGLVVKFIDKCRGLPLALEVTGKYLSTQQVRAVWDDTFKKLSQAKPLDGSKEDELWSVYQVIYDRLAEDEQQMFLDIATCFQGEELNSVKRAWRACSWAKCSADAGWQNLLDKGLVTMTPFTDRGQQGTWIDGRWTEDGCIQMHEVLRDFGRSIACPTKNVETKTRVCYDGFDRLPTWPFNQRGPSFQVRVLKIVFTGGRHFPRPRIDIETLSGLENLEIVWLDGVSLSGAWNLFPVNLEFLKLRQCYWGGNDHFERSVKTSAVEGSSSRREATSERGHPTLRQFEIEWFEDLEYLLDTLGLDTGRARQALENLVFKTRSPEALDTLDVDTRVPGETSENLDFERPPIAGTQALPESFEQPWENSENLDFERPPIAGIQALPGSFEQPWGTSENLDFERPPIAGIQALPESFEQLRCIKIDDYTVIISRCSGLAAPTKHLSISGSWFRAIPVTLGQLRGLRHLQISQCPSLVLLPATLGELGCLEDLEISNCQKLRDLPDAIGLLPSLRHLVISYCPGLVCLPYTLGKLTALRLLEILNCKRLAILPESLVELSALEHLEISCCKNLQASLGDDGPLDDEPLGVSILRIGQLDRGKHLSLPRLRDLAIFKCPSLHRLPWIQGELPALERLEITCCEGLESLAHTMGPPRALRHLVISKCRLLNRLPWLFGELPALEHLVISDCYSLKALPTWQLPALEHLVISDCYSLKALPTWQLPALEHLVISDCDSLEALPTWQLRTLRHFVISRCPRLHRFPHTFWNLSPLEHFEISCCDRLVALPDSLRQLLGRCPCNFCGNSGHWENDCLLKLESQLKQHQLTIANLSSNKHMATLIELEDPPEDSDDGSDEAGDPQDDSGDDGNEHDGKQPKNSCEFN